jgi:hypothetical protein
MKTIQLALQNPEYAQSLQNLLLRDGSHRVYVVDQPDLRLDGVVVIDGQRIDNFSILDPEPERFVVIASKSSDGLARIWDAGVRHVVFEGDSPSTAHLAIIAAEMRLPRAMPGGARAPAAGSFSKGHHSPPDPILPVLGGESGCGRCRFSQDNYGF